MLCLGIPTLATPLWVATDVGLATVAAGQAPSSGSLSRADKLRQADDLLARARQAMNENQLTVAEQLIVACRGTRRGTQSAEPPGRHSRQGSPRTPAVPSERQATTASPGSLFTAMPFGKGRDNPPAADPFSQRSAALAAAGAGTTGPVGDAAISDQPAGPGVTPLPAVVPESVPGFATVEAQAPAGPPAAGDTQSRLAADDLLLAGRRALAMGDVRRAAEMVAKAKACHATYGPKDDSPQLLQTAIEKYDNLIVAQAARKHTESYRRQFARLMMEQSDALLAWKDYGEAERLANQAKAQGINYGPLEANPDTLLERIAVARRQSQDTVALPGGGASDLPGASLAAKQNVSRLVRQARSRRRRAIWRGRCLCQGGGRDAGAGIELCPRRGSPRNGLAGHSEGADRRRRRGGASRRELRRADRARACRRRSRPRARFTTPIRIERIRFRRPITRKCRPSRPPRQVRRHRLRPPRRCRSSAPTPPRRSSNRVRPR